MFFRGAHWISPCQSAYATNPNLTQKYSGQTVDMKYQYPTVLRQIQDQVEEMLGVKFNHVMLNLYEDGTVYIGNHRDNIDNKQVQSLASLRACSDDNVYFFL